MTDVTEAPRPSALHKAIEYENVGKVTILLPLTKNINMKNEEGYTALLLAAKQNNKEILELLINHDKIDLEVGDNEDYTAMHYLALKGNLCGVSKIFERHPEIRVDNEATTKDTPLILAAKNGHTEVVKFLFGKGAGINHQNAKGYTALHYAANNDHCGTAGLLIELGADVNARNLYQETPLMKSSQWGYLEICRLLLQAGAHVDAVCNYQKTALLYATRWGNVDVAKLLLENGADVNHTGFEKYASNTFTPLQNACGINSPILVKLLLSHGAEVNSAALFVCAKSGNLEIAEMLLNRGVDVAVRGGRGAAAVVAEKHGHTDLAGMLRRH